MDTTTTLMTEANVDLNHASIASIAAHASSWMELFPDPVLASILSYLKDWPQDLVAVTAQAYPELFLSTMTTTDTTRKSKTSHNLQPPRQHLIEIIAAQALQRQGLPRNDGLCDGDKGNRSRKRKKSRRIPTPPPPPSSLRSLTYHVDRWYNYYVPQRLKPELAQLLTMTTTMGQRRQISSNTTKSTNANRLGMKNQNLSNAGTLTSSRSSTFSPNTMTTTTHFHHQQQQQHPLYTSMSAATPPPRIPRRQWMKLLIDNMTRHITQARPWHKCLSIGVHRPKRQQPLSLTTTARNGNQNSIDRKRNKHHHQDDDCHPACYNQVEVFWNLAVNMRPIHNSDTIDTSVSKSAQGGSSLLSSSIQQQQQQPQPSQGQWTHRVRGDGSDRRHRRPWMSTQEYRRDFGFFDFRVVSAKEECSNDHDEPSNHDNNEDKSSHCRFHDDNTDDLCAVYDCQPPSRPFFVPKAARGPRVTLTVAIATRSCFHRNHRRQPSSEEKSQQQQSDNNLWWSNMENPYVPILKAAVESKCPERVYEAIQDSSHSSSVCSLLFYLPKEAAHDLFHAATRIIQQQQQQQSRGTEDPEEEFPSAMAIQYSANRALRAQGLREENKLQNALATLCAKTLGEAWIPMRDQVERKHCAGDKNKKLKRSPSLG